MANENEGAACPVIDEELARRVLSVVDAGLVSGMGYPVPGQMCVEAAVCYAMGLPHDDEPTCVSQTVRLLKIHLNDRNWSSKDARAKGMRRLAIAQLGSAGVVDDGLFATACADVAVRVMVPLALRAAASIQERTPRAASAAARAAHAAEVAAASAAAYAAHAAKAAYAADAAAKAAYAADAAAHAAKAAYAAKATAAYAADAAAYGAETAAYGAARGTARDGVLATFAEAIVQVLIKLGSPGTAFLYLTETEDQQ